MIHTDRLRGPTKRATLTRDLRRLIKRGHPWVFADAIALPAGLQPGDLVTLEHDKRFVARGYVDPTGPLALRVVTTDLNEAVDEALVARRIDQAVTLRAALFADDTTGYRLINGEGDGLPGLVVDRYGGTLVIKPDGPIAESFWDVEALARHLCAVPGVTAIHSRERSRGGAVGKTLVGEVGPDTSFSEYGARFIADVREGQKTGFFLDQREHRLTLGRLSSGRRVLNAFGYTGGFSVQAGRFGATHVTTVDIAAPAIAAATMNWRANGLPDGQHTGVAADAFVWLSAAAERGDRFELVILDPPAFAPSRKDLPKAIAAYKSLIALGARVTTPGGLLFAASCSAHVTRDELVMVLDEGVSQSRRKATVLGLGGQPADHPYPLVCPELAYLKTALVALD